jgi:hypothetical protein
MSILLSNNNIVLTDKCNSLQNLTVRLVVTEDLVTVGNTGFSLQLNTYPSPGQTSQGQQLNWFQYVIAIQNNSTSGVAQYWSLGAPSSWPPGYNYRAGTTPWLPVIPGDPVWKTFGSVPFSLWAAEPIDGLDGRSDTDHHLSAVYHQWQRHGCLRLSHTGCDRCVLPVWHQNHDRLFRKLPNFYATCER